MKKSALFTALLLACASFAFSQKSKNTSKAFDEDTKFGQLGVGFGGSFFDGTIDLPPIEARYEKAVHENISVGGIIAFASSKYKYDYYNYNYSINYWLFGARANYHFATSAKLDPYAGATAGYKYITISSKGEGIYGIGSSGLLIGGQVGANYYLSHKFGVWAEAAYGIGYLSVGATMKF